MKNKFYHIVYIFLFVNVIYSQIMSNKNVNYQFISIYSWNDEILISDELNDANLTGGKQSISVNGNEVFVVWESVVSQGQSNIHVRRSTNGGSDWGNIIKITDANSETKKPVIKSDNSDVFVAWKDTRDNVNGEVYFSVSRDCGMSWSSNNRITTSASLTNLPSIDVEGNNVYIVWEEIISQPLSAKCYLVKSPDRGMSWDNILLLSDDNSIVEEGAPIVSAGQNVVHVVFGSDRHSSTTQGYNWEHYYRNSIDEGTNLGNPVRLTNDINGDSRFPMVAASNSKVHVVWWDDRLDTSYEHYGYPPTPLPTDRNYEIFYKRSLNEGLSWGEDIRLTNFSNLSSNPSIAANDDNIVVAWQDYRDGNFEIYIKYSTDGGTNWSEDERVTNDIGASEWPGVDIDDNGNIYLMWADDKSGKSKIYFIKGKVQLTNVNVKGALPDQFYIEQNYPNPFNPTTIINYSIPKQSYVTIKIIDALGREISTLVNEEKPAGNHKIIFNAVDLTSGVYFYQIKADKFMQTNKMILLR